MGATAHPCYPGGGPGAPGPRAASREHRSHHIREHGGRRPRTPGAHGGAVGRDAAVPCACGKPCGAGGHPQTQTRDAADEHI
jgi:hypothetical protein